jgi:hypothetical protein
MRGAGLVACANRNNEQPVPGPGTYRREKLGTWSGAGKSGCGQVGEAIGMRVERRPEVNEYLRERVGDDRGIVWWYRGHCIKKILCTLRNLDGFLMRYFLLHNRTSSAAIQLPALLVFWR